MQDIPSFSTMFLNSFNFYTELSFYMYLISIFFIAICYFLFKKENVKIETLSNIIKYLAIIAAFYGVLLSFVAASYLDMPEAEFIKFVLAGIASSLMPIIYSLTLLTILKVIMLFNFKIVTKTK